ncbi:MAG TPA: hypothetical protein VIF57_17180 [Polyangia bacterium]|jgi:hypothetical protein
MKGCLLVTLLLAGEACATATSVGAAAAPQPPGAPYETVTQEATIELTDEEPDAPRVVVQASSPTNVQFSGDARDVVVPVRRYRPRTSWRRAAVHQGMWVGAGLGVLAGLVSASAKEQSQRDNPGAACDPTCGGNPLLGAVVVGAIGLGLGAAAGAIIGSFGSP